MKHTNSHNKLVRGVTLVEMVVAISLMTVALSAMLPLLASIRNTWDSRQAASEILQNGRVLSDHLHRQLITATAVTDVSPDSDVIGHIEFTDDDGIARRYEIGPDGYIQYGPVGSLFDLAGPVRQFQFTCYDGNDFSTPTTDPASVRFISIETTYANASALGPDETFKTDVYIRTGEVGETEEEAEFESHIALKDTLLVSGWDAVIDSYRSSAGSYNPAHPGSEAVVSVNNQDDWSITFWNGSILRGDAYIGPGGDVNAGIVAGRGADITGTRGVLETEVDMPNISAPTGLDSYASSSARAGRGHGGGHGYGGSSSSIQLSGRSSETVTSDWEIRKIALEDHSTLIIDGHVTLVVTDTFEMSDDAKLEIHSDSSLALYVQKTFDVWGCAKLNESTDEPSRLHIYMTGNNRDFTMADDAIVHAVLENPGGDVNIYDDAEFFGKLKGDCLTSNGAIHVDLDCAFDSRGE